MAYEIRRPDEEEDAAERAPGPAAAAPAMGGMPAMGGSPGPAGNAPQASKFVSFDRILNANRDVAERGAARLNSGLTGDAQKAQDAISSKYGEFNTAVQAGTPKMPAPAQTSLTGTAPSPAGTALTGGLQPKGPSTGRNNDLGAGQTVGTVAPAAPINPAVAAQTKPRDVKTAEAMANAKYTGPTSLREYDGWLGLGAPAMAADDRLAQTQSNAGLRALAQDQNSGRVYSEGMKAMDASLLGAVGGERFKETRDRFKNLDNVMADYEGKGNAAVDFAKGEAARLQGQGQPLVDEYNTKLANDKTEAERNALEADRLKKTHGSYGEYADPNRMLGDEKDHAWFIRNGLRVFDPIGFVANMAGHDGLHDKATDWVEDQVGGARHSRTIMGGDGWVSRADMEAIYPHITQAELDALEAMQPKDRQAWVQNKKNELGLT